MMNKSIIFNFAKVFIVLDGLLILYSLVFENVVWLLNSQTAFLGSLFVTIASFFSYRKNIKNRLSNFDTSKSLSIEEDRDKIDEIDDPFDLYSKDKNISEEELTPAKIKEIIQEEKKKVNKNSFKNTLFSAGGFVSIYRVMGYLVLVFGFFALNNNHLFIAIPFLVGLAIVPFGALISKFSLKSEEGQ